jgi:hypothetical protein
MHSTAVQGCQDCCWQRITEQPHESRDNRACVYCCCVTLGLAASAFCVAAQRLQGRSQVLDTLAVLRRYGIPPLRCVCMTRCSAKVIPLVVAVVPTHRLPSFFEYLTVCGAMLHCSPLLAGAVAVEERHCSTLLIPMVCRRNGQTPCRLSSGTSSRALA